MARWRNRTSTEEAVRGTKPASTVRTPAEETAIVLFRQQTLLPLDDCLYALQEAIPHLRRSALPRCFQRHGVSRLPPAKGRANPKKRSSKTIPSATRTSILPRYTPKKGSSTAQMPDAHFYRH